MWFVMDFLRRRRSPACRCIAYVERKQQLPAIVAIQRTSFATRAATHPARAAGIADDARQTALVAGNGAFSALFPLLGAF